MARYEHLPIYKKAMDLTIYFEKIVRNFSRYHKYTLGTELRGRWARGGRHARCRPYACLVRDRAYGV